MDFMRKVKVEMITSMEDWLPLRECYVHSFIRYPLYKYMVPDESKREEFLRAYLDANYEVTVGSGQGILLGVKIPSSKSDDPNCKDESGTKVIGGVLFLPPSENGCGWAIGSDEPYWEAYEKYGLARISKEGYERVIRYEAWENEQISQKASNTRVPLWNGLFCAIAPEYSAQGIGTAVYKEAIRMMAEYWIKKRNAKTTQKTSGCEDSQFQSKIVNDLSLKQLHSLTLLSHRCLPQLPLKKGENQASEKKRENKNSRGMDSIKGLMFNTSAPLVVAISHSDRAARFHESNGFCPVVRVPYHDEVEGTSPFFAHVLVLDPFRTGRIDEVSAGLEAKNIKLKDENSSIVENLIVAQPDRLLVH